MVDKEPKLVVPKDGKEKERKPPTLEERMLREPPPGMNSKGELNFVEEGDGEEGEDDE